MPKYYEDLTEGQKKLHDNLVDKITKGTDDNISSILKGASQKDLLAVLNTQKISDDRERTLTPLAYAMYLNNSEKIKAILDVAKENNMLEEILNTTNIIKLSNGRERTLTPLGYAIDLNNLEEEIKAILGVAKENNMLEKVLNTPNIIKLSDGEERTLTPLTYAIDANNQEQIKAILDVAKENNMLEKVLNTPNIIKLSNGEEHTLTPLAYAMYFYCLEGQIKAILDVAKENNMLEKVLNTPNIIKLSNGKERTLTAFGYAISNNSEEQIKAILDVAEKDKKVLKEVFAGVEERDRKRLTEILETLKNEEQKTKIDGWLEILAKNVPSSHKSDKHPLAPESSIPKAEENIANNEGMFEIESNISKIENSDKYPQKDTVKTINRSIMIGSVCGVVAALAAGGGCFAAGVALPMLALIGIAVAAALVIGVIAGGISYVVLRPSDDECLSKPQKSVVNSPKSQNKVQSQISDQEPKITIPQHLAEENLKESVSKADTNVKLTENSLKPNVVQQSIKIGNYFEFTDNELLFVITNKNYTFLKAQCKNKDIPEEFRVFVECKSGRFIITGSYNSQQNVGDEKKSVSITSVKKWNNMGLSGDPRSRLEMMNKLELYEIGKFLEVTEISDKSLMTPKMKQSHTTSNPQMVNNTTIDQATSSTVTNEHKEISVNAHEEKDEHNNAASNRKVQPVEVDAEVKILMGDLLSEVSAQDSDKVEKTPISKRSERESFPSGSGEEEFYDTEDKQLSSITSDDDTLEFQGAIDDGITQPRLINSDMVVEQSRNQTPSAVLNKSQGNNIVINSIFIPYGANLKCLQELSNFLSKTSLERDKLFWKVVPNSSLFQPRKERLAINGQSIDAQ